MLGPLDRAFPLGLAYPRLASRQAERVQTVQWVHFDPSAPLTPHRNDSDLGRSLLSVSVGPSTTRPGRPPWPAGHFHDWPADRQSVSRPSNGSISTHRHPCHCPRHDSDLGRSLMFLSVGPGITRPGRTSLAGQAHTHLASRQAERESTGTHMALARCSCRKSCPHHTRRGIEPALSLIFPMPAAPVVSWHNFRTLNPIHIRRGQSTGIY